MNVAREILTDAAKVLWDARRLLVLLVLAVVVGFLVERLVRRRGGRWSRRGVPVLAMAAVLGGGLWLGWQTAFVCDDAFISFRYARNLAEGHGLVWNKGEWVEGYTNFLWTAMLGGLAKLGADIPQAALLGCLVSFVIALAGVTATVRRVAPRPPVLPFAALALAGAVPFYTFATSGLETMPGAALIVLGMYSSTLRRRGALLAGLALTAATMMRPDHVLFYACFGLAMAGEDIVHGRQKLLRRLDFPRYFAYLAPFFLIYVPYFLIRWRAYGDFYPNTYYAKSGDRAYWAQGSVYALHFLATSGAWMWIWTAVLGLLGWPRTRHETRVRLFALLVVPIFSTYIAKVGGDFMEHRFFVPLMPVLAIATEVGLRWRIARPKKVWTRAVSMASAALGIGVALVPVQIIKGRGIRWNIAHEPGFYRVRTVDPLVIDCPWENLGKELNTALTSKGVEPPLAAGAIGLLGYHSRLPVVDGLGLTNRMIAHKPIKGRGRPGHEKVANVPELIGQGAVVDVGFRFDPSFKESAAIRIGAARLYFLRLDPRWAAAIGRLPGAKLPTPERDIEALVLNAPRERVLAAKKFFRDFLAIHPSRDALLRRIDDRLAAVADFEADLPEGAKREGKGLHVERGERPSGASGDAWLASLPDGKKGAVGRIEIPIGPIVAEELRFALGGAPSERISVELVVDGVTVRSARPTGAPGLSPVAWRVDDLLGDSCVLVLDDSDPAPGKGLVIDAIHFAPLEGDIRQRIAVHGDTFDPALGELLREARVTLPAGDPDRRRLEVRVATHISLDVLPEGARLTGTAFGKGPVGKALPGQDPVVGQEGTGFLNSFHGLDPAKGKVVLPDFTIPKTPLNLLVSGGQGCGKVYVGLEVGDKVVQRVCGKNDHFFRREELRPGAFAGKRGHLVVVDDSDGPWGHILIDDILIPR